MLSVSVLCNMMYMYSNDIFSVFNLNYFLYFVVYIVKVFQSTKKMDQI